MRLPCSDWYREQVLLACLNLIPKPPIPKYIAIGTGGCYDNDVLHPIPIDTASNSLNNEVFRKELDGLEKGNGLFGIIRGHISGEDISGIIVSEVAILDEKGNLIGQVSFEGKSIGLKTRIEFSFELIV